MAIGAPRPRESTGEADTELCFRGKLFPHKPITTAGTVRMVAIFAQAAAIENAARLVAMGGVKC